MTPGVGTIGWTDLTVADAEKVRDFYVKVVGWKAEGVEMGGYSDYAMAAPESGQMVAGVCWKRGINADIPSQWLVYLTVKDLKAAVASCRKLGGAVVVGPRPLSGGNFAVIRDPAGAVCALFEPPGAETASKPAAKAAAKRRLRSKQGNRR